MAPPLRQFRRSARKRAAEEAAAAAAATVATAAECLPTVPIVAAVKKQKRHECSSVDIVNESSDFCKEKIEVEAALQAATQIVIKQEKEDIENKSETEEEKGGQEKTTQRPSEEAEAAAEAVAASANASNETVNQTSTTTATTIAAEPPAAISKYNNKINETLTTTSASAPAQKNINNKDDNDDDEEEDIKPDLDKLEQDFLLLEQQQKQQSQPFAASLTLTPAQASQLAPLFLISRLTPVNSKNIVFSASGGNGVAAGLGGVGVGVVTTGPDSVGAAGLGAPGGFSIDSTASFASGGATVAGLGSIGTINPGGVRTKSLGIPGTTNLGIPGTTNLGVSGTINPGDSGIINSDVFGGINNPGVSGIINSGVSGIINSGVSGIISTGISGIINTGISGILNSTFPGVSDTTDSVDCSITLPSSIPSTKGFNRFIGGGSGVHGIKVLKKIIQTPPAPSTVSSGKKSHVKNLKRITTINNWNPLPAAAIEPFEKDEIDLQESDIDEEGYEDINFEDDAKEIIVEKDDDSDLYDPEWTDKQIAPRLFFLFKTPPTEVGLDWRPKSKDAIFYFEKVIGDRNEFFFQLTNSVTSQVNVQNLTNMGDPSTHIKPVTKEEMEFFFGLCLQMSSMRLPRLSEYWNEKAYYNFNGFDSKMSFSRFQLILRLLNFDKLGGECKTTATTSLSYEILQQQPRDVALTGLQPLVNFFNQRMAEIYKCGERLVLNEPLVFWKSKVDCVRNMAEKFRENAVTMHFLTERTGLILKILLDVERKERRQCVRNSKVLVQQRVRLAKELLKEQLGKGHVVFASKYYGSYALGYELGQHKTYCTGFLDSKRYGNSKELIMTNLRKNIFATKYAQPVMMGKLRLREKYAYFYSSDCLAIYIQETKIFNSDRRPKIVKELDWQLKTERNFRECMLNYQMGLENSSKQMKWDKQIAIYIFNLIVLNAYILYSMYSQMERRRIVELHLEDPRDLKTYDEFRQDIIATLLKTNIDIEDVAAKQTQKEVWEELKRKFDEKVATEKKKLEKKITRMINNDISSDDDAAAAAAQLLPKTVRSPEGSPHEPISISNRNYFVRKKCKICLMSGFLTFAKMCCERCTGVPALCEKPCFKIWHDHLNIKTAVG